MEHRSIGSLRVSLVGLGCNNFGMRIDDAATERVVDAALEVGINFFDNADIYGATKSEEFLGKALKGRRDRAIVATKFGMAVDEQRKGARPEYVRQACDDSLRRLGTDRIDLYQLHQPDPSVPIADTLGALDGLVKAGKVREIGCSNLSAEQLDEAGARHEVRRGAIRQRAERIQSAASRPRAQRAAGVRPAGTGVPSLLPAGERVVDRQVPARKAGARRQPSLAVVDLAIHNGQERPDR